jgi:hypothetical protein
MKEDILHCSPQCKYLDRLRAESRVIPRPALAAGTMPTWPPGKVTGNLDIDIPLRRGPGMSRSEAAQSSA